MTWRLDNALDRNIKSPYTFYIPCKKVIDILSIGDQVKLLFLSDKDECERMWVEITEIIDDQYKGILRNEPIEIIDLHFGQIVEFNGEHICDTEYKDPNQDKWDYYLDKKVVVSKDVLVRKEYNFMLRDNPRNGNDTGWTISSGFEDDEYCSDSNNLQIISIGVILNIDDSIIEYLNDEPQCAYEKSNNGQFIKIYDYDWDEYNGLK